MTVKPAEATFERTILVNGDVDLDVATHCGVIRVAGGEPGVVRVRGILRGRRSLFGLGDTRGRIAEMAANPPIEQQGSSIRVGDLHDRWLLRGVTMLLEIVVPHATRVRALADAGDVRVQGIAGPVRAEADSGSIEMADINGDVRASADSGSIRIHRVRGSVDANADSGSVEALDIGGPITAATDSGDIRLSQSAPAPVAAEADSGSISLRLAPDAGYNVRIHTDSGHVRTPPMAVQGRSSGNETEGQIRGGGPLVRLDTDSGSIEIL